MVLASLSQWRDKRAAKRVLRRLHADQGTNEKTYLALWIEGYLWYVIGETEIAEVIGKSAYALEHKTAT